MMWVPLTLSLWLPDYLLLKAPPFLSPLPARPTLSLSTILSAVLKFTARCRTRWAHARTHARARTHTPTHEQEREKPFKDATTHIANIGEMVEDMEGRMRDALYEVD